MKKKNCLTSARRWYWEEGRWRKSNHLSYEERQIMRMYWAYRRNRMKYGTQKEWRAQNWNPGLSKGKSSQNKTTSDNINFLSFNSSFDNN